MVSNHSTSNSEQEKMFCQLNVCKISKHSEIVIDKFMADKNIKLLAAQETGAWIPSPKMFTSFKIFQNKSSADSNLAGVALIIDKALVPEHIAELSEDNVDAIWGQIKLNGRRVLVGSVYSRPMHGATHLTPLLTHMEKVLEYKQKHKFTSMMIYGDFNCRHTDWGDHKTEARGRTLKAFTDKFSLTICSPFDNTFVCENGGSVIDLLLIQGNISGNIATQWMDKSTELFTGAPRRGHYPVLHNIQVKGMTENTREVKTDWKAADWDSWNEQVETALNHWISQHPESSGEVLWKTLLAIVKQATKDHIPTKLVSIHSQPFWNHTLSDVSKTAQEARSNFQNRSTPHNREELDTALKNFREMLIDAKNSWIRKRTESINVKDCQQFWKRYKGVFGVNQDKFICNLEDAGVLHTTDVEKEKVLYETFFTGKHLLGQQRNSNHDNRVMRNYNSIVSQLRQAQQRNDSHLIDESELNQEIEIKEIEEAITKQKATDKAVDDDGIHPSILKQLGKTAKEALQKIFNFCLTTGEWLWTDSFVTFIRKPDKKTYSQPGAYRPITISSYFGKVMERIKDSRLRIFFLGTGQIDDDQEGFLNGRSTSRYLFRLLANLNEVKRKKMACLILFIDFSKAFDSVHIPSLIVKLEKMGVRGKMLALIKAFLEDRAIRLKVNKFKGIRRICGLFGLPQGSALSPLLFIIYISDMAHSTPSRIRAVMGLYKFADDGTIMIYAHNMIICHELMQELCDYLNIWCIDNKLVPNCDKNKTEAMILQTGNTAYNSLQEFPPKLLIGGTEIEYVRQTKALGVTIDDQLTFQGHAEKKLKVCNQSWGNLSKTTNRNHGLNVRSLTLLLKTVVLTKLHYASPLWLHANLEVFKGFWNNVVMRTSGAMLNPHREITELALHLPPLEVQLSILTTKFLCKCVTSGDFISSLVLQIEGSQTQFLPQLISLKEFIAWRKGFRSAREVELTNQDHVAEAYYSKGEINKYQTFIWTNRIRSKCQVQNRPSLMDYSLLEVLQREDIATYQLNGDNFLFNHNTTKGLDSYMMDYIHGNSFIFGNVRASISKGEKPSTCYFCNTETDSATHQIEQCTEVEENTHRELLTQLNSPGASGNIIKDLIFPLNDRVQLAFIERIDFLKGQHEHVIGLGEELDEDQG